MTRGSRPGSNSPTASRWRAVCSRSANRIGPRLPIMATQPTSGCANRQSGCPAASAVQRWEALAAHAAQPIPGCRELSRGSHVLHAGASRTDGHLFRFPRDRADAKRSARSLVKALCRADAWFLRYRPFRWLSLDAEPTGNRPIALAELLQQRRLVARSSHILRVRRRRRHPIEDLEAWRNDRPGWTTLREDGEGRMEG